MRVGHLQSIGTVSGHYKGTINTLKFSLRDFEVRPNPEAGRSPDAPNYEVVARNGGGEVPVGLGWEKEIQRGDSAGKTMINITFDDPSMERPIYVAAFPSAKEGPAGEYIFDLVWSRPKGAKPAGTDDQIPY